jgi:hypothetical protein
MINSAYLNWKKFKHTNGQTYMFFYPIFLGINTESFIRNVDKPSCTKCIYYQPRTYSEYTSTLGKCTKFGDKDIHTGMILYDYAESCRRDDSKCCTKGTYFTTEPNLYFKQLKHSIQSNPLGICFLFVMIVLIKNM